MDAHLARLPSITAALVLEGTGLEVFRDQFGMLQCQQRGIGPRRKKLGPIGEDPWDLIAQGDDPGPIAAEVARDGARHLLAGLCLACPFAHCKMKAWDIG